MKHIFSRIEKLLLLSACLTFGAVGHIKGDVTVDYSTYTVDDTTNPTNQNFGNILTEEENEFLIKGNASTAVSDTATYLEAAYIYGAYSTFDLQGNGANLSFNAPLNRKRGNIFNFVTSNTGSGVSQITTASVANATTVYWALYDSNDWAAGTAGGVIESAQPFYNNSGAYTVALTPEAWNASNTPAQSQAPALSLFLSDNASATYDAGAITAGLNPYIGGLRFQNAAGAQFNIGSNTLETIAFLDAQGAGAVAINGGSIYGLHGVLVFEQENTANTFTINSSILPTAGYTSAVTFAGPGTTIVSGSNTYNGATYVTSGRVVYDGSNPNSVVYVDQGATFGGDGTMGQTVTALGKDSIIAPGDIGQIGTFTVDGLLTAANGLTLDFKLDGRGTAFGVDNDFIDASGLSLNGTVVVNITTSDSLVTGTPYLLMAGGIWSGSPTFEFNLPAGYAVESYDYDQLNAEFTVEFESVPEPSTYAMLLGGGAGLLFLARRSGRQIAW